MMTRSVILRCSADKRVYARLRRAIGRASKDAWPRLGRRPSRLASLAPQGDGEREAGAATFAALTRILLLAFAVVWPLPALAQSPATRNALVPFELSPFPYHGISPRTGKPFLDV